MNRRQSRRRKNLQLPELKVCHFPGIPLWCGPKLEDLPPKKAVSEIFSYLNESKLFGALHILSTSKVLWIEWNQPSYNLDPYDCYPGISVAIHNVSESTLPGKTEKADHFKATNCWLPKFGKDHRPPESVSDLRPFDGEWVYPIPWDWFIPENFHHQGGLANKNSHELKPTRKPHFPKKEIKQNTKNM